MNSKSRLFITATMVITVCLMLLTFGTYALFSDTIEVTHHLQAGTLEATLVRTNLKYNYLGDDGYLYEKENNDIVDFSDSTNLMQNVFDINSDTIVVPGNYFESTMELDNNGTVAFSYWIKIVLNDEIASDLASQLKVVVTTYDNDENEIIFESYLKDGLEVGNEINPLGEIAANATSPVTFKVKIYFEHNSQNNQSMNDQINFDIAVYAVQVVE